jgi:hypothetical protein
MRNQMVEVQTQWLGSMLHFSPLLMQRIALARSKCAKWQKSAGKTK